ncbi:MULTISPECIES: DUF1461 domain-containing protein [unclassified Oceanobacter]|uniref:lipoprotein intramolecular transacylase Lit n=1 Tax=unclassified Oceanobacter TaxID=2620260 RepID=UPI0027368DC1|nr:MULTISPECIES: DUF1461 domain-containing protein [unclassified Oceanobacter]MDP2504303.1 DUF1461 domain-containing protein [Oceanobacter sp. 3_MG-2023]MDP2608519.1 DUF1461 domain-containing protein [Oceanobacter sp. 1_MG-2023]MDP2611719.1 DUF1461 domain-containing protein [Oceanobacter sp. 2_MG-2023]
MKYIQQVGWFFVLVSALLLALSLSWFGQAAAHYGFDYWYEFYDIDNHIERYGPQNRYIRGLDSLDKAEHVRLFNAISEAVHDHGEGLQAITFAYRGKTRVLLRKPEVVHLQDVANLIDVLRLASGVFALVAIGGTWWLRRQRPRWGVQGALLGGLLGLTLVSVLLIGPKQVFYHLHKMIFPPDHAWFFYYQDSLMATLMKAPDLFGGIAVTITAGGLLLFGFYLVLLIRWQQHQTGGKG